MGAARAGVAGGVRALGFGVGGVFGEDVAVGLDGDRAVALVAVGGVGGYGVAPAGVPVDPCQCAPRLGVAGVGRDEDHVLIVAGAFDRGDEGHEQEVEGLDLLGVSAPLVEVAQKPVQVRRGDG